MTDIIKYRAPASAVGSQEVRQSFNEFVRPELEHIDPELIITFGNRAWTPFRDELQTEPVADGVDDAAGITDLHGHLHETGRVLDTHVLSLGHMSTQFYGAQLSKDEYMERMREGLSMWDRRSN